jgi:outer membrane protein assembly factor BamB
MPTPLSRAIAVIAALMFFLAQTVAGDEPWWQFRGPEGNGHARAKQLPLKWSETENIVWKTAIHDRGCSSPVQLGDQIWLTSATEDGHKLFAICVDQHSGQILHDLPIFDVEKPQAIAPVNSYATPTPVIESGRVYLHFGTYGTACVETTTGSILWTRRDLNCDHEDGAGPCSSPYLTGELLIVHVDGRDVQYVIAMNKNTGETVWKAERSFDYDSVEVHQRKAFTMPLLVPYGDGQQLLSQGAQAIYSYEPSTGQELWKLRCPGFSIAPRPVFGFGMAFVVSDHDHPELWAIRTDGAGDVSDTHVVWKATAGIPARASILLVDDLLYVVNHQGILSCLEAKTGETVWKERIEGKYSASPIYWGDRIYLFNEDSVCTVVKPGREYEALAVNHLDGEQLLASPAVVDDAIVIRTQNHLYRVEAAWPSESR